MKCPNCGSTKFKTIDSRPNEELNAIRRRKDCLNCGERITTFETIAERRAKKFDQGDIGFWKSVNQKPKSNGDYFVHVLRREGRKYKEDIKKARYDAKLQNWECAEVVQDWMKIPTIPT